MKNKETTKEEASSSETWLINSNLDTSDITISQAINFTSNGTSYSLFYRSYVAGPTSPMTTDVLQYNSRKVYEFGSWGYMSYRTVTFKTAPTGDLLTWLQANAVKQ